MINILIATHGKMAEGAISAINIIIGDTEDIHFINGYVDNDNIRDNIKKYFDKVASNDDIIICTDLYGGSVNNNFIQYIKRPKTHIIAGFNLALLLEIVLLPKDLCDIENEIRNILQRCSNSMCYVNDKINENLDEDFD